MNELRHTRTVQWTMDSSNQNGIFVATALSNYWTVTMKFPNPPKADNVVDTLLCRHETFLDLFAEEPFHLVIQQSNVDERRQNDEHSVTVAPLNTTIFHSTRSHIGFIGVIGLMKIIGRLVLLL